MQAMIFAAGLGTRLKPLTDTMPKALVPLCGRPLLEHLLLKLKAAGFTHVVINIHHFPDQIINFVHNNNDFGLHIAFSDERDNLLETGGGLRKARPLFDSTQPLLVHNVDILSNIDLGRLMQVHQPDHLGTLVVSLRQTSRYLLFDKTMRLCGWMNEQTHEKRPANLQIDFLQKLAFAGIQVVSPRIFEKMEAFPNKFSIMELYLQQMGSEILQGYQPQSFQMMDVGKINTIKDAETFCSSL